VSSGWIVTLSHSIPIFGSSVIVTLPATDQPLSVVPVDLTVTEYVSAAWWPGSTFTAGWLTRFSIDHWCVRTSFGWAVMVTVHAEAAGATTSVAATTEIPSRNERTTLFGRRKTFESPFLTCHRGRPGARPCRFRTRRRLTRPASRELGNSPIV
jgi:hypothetical protein